MFFLHYRGAKVNQSLWWSECDARQQMHLDSILGHRPNPLDSNLCKFLGFDSRTSHVSLHNSIWVGSVQYIDWCYHFLTSENLCLMCPLSCPCLHTAPDFDSFNCITVCSVVGNWELLIIIVWWRLTCCPTQWIVIAMVGVLIDDDFDDDLRRSRGHCAIHTAVMVVQE